MKTYLFDQSQLLRPAAGLLFLLAVTTASADQQIPALQAIERVAEKHHPRFVEKIVEMKGSQGQSQPEEWELIVHDPSNAYLLREFWIGDTRATNEGINYDYYPKRQPTGFIDRNRLKLGSVAAFEILNREADRAKIGFDSIDYHLRCREFSSEPIWTLVARDVDGYQVARVDLSGESGRVLRTVWSYGQGREGFSIKDSAVTGVPVPVIEPPVPRVDDSQPVGPGTRPEPEVPELIEIDPGNEVPEVIEIDPGNEVPEVIPVEPEALPGVDEP